MKGKGFHNIFERDSKKIQRIHLAKRLMKILFFQIVLIFVQMETLDFDFDYDSQNGTLRYGER